VHLSASERQRLAKAGAALVHCPSANLFLGSGLFDYAAARSAGISVGLGTDIGAGTSLCLLDTLRAFYGVQMIQGTRLTIAELLYAATMGGAEAIGLADQVGSFAAGKRADFVELAPAADGLFAARWEQTDSLEERFFATAMLGGEAAIRKVWIAGQYSV
jgi:guanine deaminase